MAIEIYNLDSDIRKNIQQELIHTYNSSNYYSLENILYSDKTTTVSYGENLNENQIVTTSVATPVSDNFYNYAIYRVRNAILRAIINQVPDEIYLTFTELLQNPTTANLQNFYGENLIYNITPSYDPAIWDNFDTYTDWNSIWEKVIYTIRHAGYDIYYCYNIDQEQPYRFRLEISPTGDNISVGDIGDDNENEPQFIRGQYIEIIDSDYRGTIKRTEAANNKFTYLSTMINRINSAVSNAIANGLQYCIITWAEFSEGENYKNFFVTTGSSVSEDQLTKPFTKGDNEETISIYPINRVEKEKILADNDTNTNTTGETLAQILQNAGYYYLIYYSNATPPTDDGFILYWEYGKNTQIGQSAAQDALTQHLTNTTPPDTTDYVTLTIPAAANIEQLTPAHINSQLLRKLNDTLTTKINQAITAGDATITLLWTDIDAANYKTIRANWYRPNATDSDYLSFDPSYVYGDNYADNLEGSARGKDYATILQRGFNTFTYGGNIDYPTRRAVTNATKNNDAPFTITNNNDQTEENSYAWAYLFYRDAILYRNKNGTKLTWRKKKTNKKGTTHYRRPLSYQPSCGIVIALGQVEASAVTSVITDYINLADPNGTKGRGYTNTTVASDVSETTQTITFNNNDQITRKNMAFNDSAIDLDDSNDTSNDEE